MPSCSLPSGYGMVGVGLQQQAPPTTTTTTTTTSRPVKKFEVAEVLEETADSPPLSDLSAQSSTENVIKESTSHPPLKAPPPTEGSESNAATATTQQHQQQVPPLSSAPPPSSSTRKQLSMGGLESSSDSNIMANLMSSSGGRGGGDSHSCTPEPTGMVGGGPDYHLPRQSYPFPVPPYSSQFSFHPHNYGGYPTPHHSWTVTSMPPPSLPMSAYFPTDHYNTTTYLPRTDPPASSGVHYTSSNRSSTPSVLSYHQPHTPFEQATPPGAPSVPQLPSFADVPHADLLAKAFMTFLHSIGAVFRDPAFMPLLQSLDQHFDSKTHPPPPPPSAATTAAAESPKLAPSTVGVPRPPSPSPSSPSPVSPGFPGNEPNRSPAGGGREMVIPEGTSDEDVARMIDK